MSYVSAQHAAYRRGEVLAASPAQLVVLLYDGARRFLRQATVAMRAGEIERTHTRLRNAERIIRHLDGTLDFEQGQVAQNLHSIYAFCLAHLDSARLSQDPAKVEQVGEMLGELREAWAEIAAAAERGELAAGAQRA
jgi:flagellar secretion chaperone FliS